MVAELSFRKKADPSRAGRLHGLDSRECRKLPKRSLGPERELKMTKRCSK